MSAIFGIYYLDGRLVQPQHLDKMSGVLAHRGSDTIGSWIKGAVGLGHRMLWTTPESLNERLPRASQDNKFAITADARIDNREDLLSQLDILVYGNDEAISDSEIILAAYKKWGEECVHKLIGDFAFAIWDGRSNSIFCARDHFGVKPFYYVATGKAFIFATEIKALFVLSEIPREVNELMIADYIVTNFDDRAATFYKDVFRLPPAHSLICTSAQMLLRRYYELDPTTESSERSDEEYAEGLREIFTESVRCRMRSAFPIGAMLSGGLDSSSIACVSRNLLKEASDALLPTFSLVYDRIRECDERSYISATLAQGGFEPRFLPGDEYSPLDNLDSVCWHADRPALGPGASGMWEIYKTINRAGVRVVFDGHDGDSAVSYGYKYLDELAQAGRWVALAVEAKNLAELFSMTPQKIMWAFVVHYGWKPFVQSHPRLRRAGRAFGSRYFSKSSGKVKPNIFTERRHMLNADFARRVDFDCRYRSREKLAPAKNAREDHYQTVTSGLQSLGLEELDSRSAAHGVETRYPFWDRRLIEYCLSLPGSQKCKGGWNRVVMRRAMTNILPNEVCWRQEKTDFTANFVQHLINGSEPTLSNFFSGDDNVLDQFFDVRTLTKTYHAMKYDTTPDRGNLRMFWDIASLSSWLQLQPSLN